MENNIDISVINHDVTPLFCICREPYDETR